MGEKRYVLFRKHVTYLMTILSTEMLHFLKKKFREIQKNLLTSGIYCLTLLVWAWLLIPSLPASGQTDPTPPAEDIAAETEDTLATDVRASIVVISPLDNVYSCLGHAALRMECPSDVLDYIYTLETNTEDSSIFHFITADMPARVIGAKTKEYLALCSQDGRGVKQYELNLNLKQKRALWRNLDQETLKKSHLRFDIKGNHCTAVIMRMIVWSLEGEQIDFKVLPQVMKENGGDMLRWSLRRSPWYAFFAVTIGGAECDKDLEPEFATVPENIRDVLAGAVITDSKGVKRPALPGEESELLPCLSKVTTTWLTPLHAFLILLLLVLFITWAEWKWGWKKTALATDITLLTMQTLIGVTLLYTTLISNICGTGWNWYLIPFNPLPLLIWLIAHKSKDFGKVYAIYTAVLILFLLIAPFTSQTDLPHQLITASLLTRCLSRYFEYKKKNNISL